MKRQLTTLCLIGCFALSLSAQMKQPQFRPDWIFETPRPENATFLYVVEHGEGNTKREALNQAIGRVFQSTANRIGQPVSSAEINKSVQQGVEFDVIARNIKIPVNKVCEFPVQDPQTNAWTVYILCQVAKAGNITPEFETTDACTKHEKFDAFRKKWEETQAKEKKRTNTLSVVSSAFLPGVGQMMKGHTGEGIGTLVGELALFGGGTACYFVGKQQQSVMNTRGTSYNDYMNAKHLKNTCDITMYSLFGAGAAVYVFNLCRAYMCSDRRLTNNNLALYSVAIPAQDNQYAVGLGVQYKF